MEDWLQSSTTSLRNDGVFQAPTLSSWSSTSAMATVDSYKAMGDLLTTMAQLSSVLSQGKQCDVAVLHDKSQHLAVNIGGFKACEN